MARYGDGGLKPAIDTPEFPEYLQWFHYCEGMVMPPINTIMVHSVLLPPDRRNPETLGQAQRLLSRAVAPVDAALEGREYLIDSFDLTQCCAMILQVYGKPRMYGLTISYTF